MIERVKRAFREYIQKCFQGNLVSYLGGMFLFKSQVIGIGSYLESIDGKVGIRFFDSWFVGCQSCGQEKVSFMEEEVVFRKVYFLFVFWVVFYGYLEVWFSLFLKVVILSRFFQFGCFQIFGVFNFVRIVVWRGFYFDFKENWKLQKREIFLMLLVWFVVGRRCNMRYLFFFNIFRGIYFL